jgi:hypothetical protein
MTWLFEKDYRTVDSPQSGFSRFEQFRKVTGFCGDGRAVIRPYTLADTEQGFKVTVLSGSGGCSPSGLSTESRNFGLNAIRGLVL